jgi:predicted esterase
MRRILAFPILLFLLAGSTAPAAESRQDLVRRYRAFQAALLEAVERMKAKDYDAAITELRKADRLVSRRPVVHYNLACALSLKGETEPALDALADAVTFGFHDAEHMNKDPDLAAVRETERFRNLVAQAERRAKAKEPLIHVPDGYRKDGDRTYPLFVALHGAGGRAKGMMYLARQALGTEAYFLLAPYGSSPAGTGHTWNGRDVDRVTAEIDELKKKYRIGRVYLFGFSAGAHVGYVFVLKRRDHFDGFIPMAGALRERWVTDDDLKNAKELAVFAIQGTEDPVVPPAAARRSLAQLRKHGAATKLFTHPGAHRAPERFRQVLRDAIEWIDTHAAPAEDK